MTFSSFHDRMKRCFNMIKRFWYSFKLLSLYGLKKLIYTYELIFRAVMSWLLTCWDFPSCLRMISSSISPILSCLCWSRVNAIWIQATMSYLELSWSFPSCLEIFFTLPSCFTVSFVQPWANEFFPHVRWFSFELVIDSKLIRMCFTS